jgi:hypothetical protein
MWQCVCEVDGRGLASRVLQENHNIGRLPAEERKELRL